MSSHYQHHVFFCLNEREDGSRCCADFGAKAMQEYAKKRCKELGINGEGRVRVDLRQNLQLSRNQALHLELLWRDQRGGDAFAVGLRYQHYY